jgi:hypothetical protein
MDMLDYYRRLLGGGEFGDPSIPAMSSEPLGAQGYGADALSYLQDAISPKPPATPSQPTPSSNVYAPQPNVGIDRTNWDPVNNGGGTYWDNAKQAVSEMGTAAAGLAERFNKGALNTLGFRQPNGDIYRGNIPVAEGLARAGDVATFATGGLANSLFPAGGAYRGAAQYALPAAREAAQGAAPVARGLLADTAGELRLTPRQRKLATLDLERPLPSVEDLNTPLPYLGSNSMQFNIPTITPDLPPAAAPPARVRQGAPNLPRGREANFGEQLRAAHLENEDALPLTGAQMKVTPPPHVTNEEELNGLVGRYVDDVLRGLPGRYWYEKSGRGILEHTGSPEVATPFAGGLARTSPQTDVASNMTHAITLHNQYMAGDPLRAGRFPNAMGADVEKIYRGGEAVTGEKIGPFMGAVAHQWAPDMFPHELVNDIWNMRILEYPGEGGALYSGSPTSGQHNFARIVADRARRRLEEITGEPWHPREVQETGWTGGKSRLEGTTPQEAGFNFSDALRRNYAQASYESVPGTTTGYFPEIATAPEALRQQYHSEIKGALTDPETGRDYITSHLGMLTGRTFDAPGYFEGITNPGSQVPIAVGSAPGGSLKGIDDASRELIQTGERVRGLLLNQDAVAAHKPLWAGNVPVGQRSLYDVSLGRSLTPEETIAVAKGMHETSGSDFFSPIATARGFRFRNVPEYSQVPNRDFIEHARKLLERDDILPGIETTGVHAASDGFYEYNDWKLHPDGETYRLGLGATRSPDLQRRAAELLATLGEKVSAINDRYAKDYGWTQGPQRRFWEEPAYQSFKVAPEDLGRAPRPGEIRPSSEAGPNWRPLFGPGSVLGSLLAMIGGGSALAPQGAEARPRSAGDEWLNQNAPFPTLARPQAQPLQWTDTKPTLDPADLSNYGPGSPFGRTPPDPRLLAQLREWWQQHQEQQQGPPNVLDYYARMLQPGGPR